jgi:ABC-type uncharacterized transport system substrate-binding protein
MSGLTVEQIVEECGLKIIERVADPSYFMIHLYTQAKEGVDWEKAAENCAERIYNEKRIANKIYKGKKHPDLYNFSAIDEE